MEDERVLMQGNEALAEAAFRAGLDFYAGYPITPQTEILEYLARRMQRAGRAFIQAESELAAINMINGAALTGKRVLTSSGGPGISLKQEGISYAASARLPIVFANVQRGGNGLATQGSCQSDYLRDTRGGGNGDYRVIVLSPSSVQETVDMTYKAFDLAEKYRSVVEIYTEASIGQLVEPVALPPQLDPGERQRPAWALTGQMLTGPGRGSSDQTRNRKVVAAEKDRQTMLDIMEAEQQWESLFVDDADYVLVACGGPARVCYDVLDELRARGQKVGLIRPKTLWPYPVNAFREVNPQVRGLIVVETNFGQMVEDVALAKTKVFRHRVVPVYSLAYITANRLPSVDQVMADYDRIIAGTLKEAY